MHKKSALSWSLVFGLVLGMGAAQAKPLEIHRIFSSNMVIQRDKPVVIWGFLTVVQVMAAKAPVKIFLLSGQSNLSGRGVLGDLNKPAADQKATLVQFVKATQTHEQKDAATNWWRMVRDAQVAISQRPEFRGNVATAETRDFWHPREQFGGSNQGIHWNSNGESYWLMGEAMGREMVKLLDAK